MHGRSSSSKIPGNGSIPELAENISGKIYCWSATDFAKLARYRSEDGKTQKSMDIMDVNPQAVQEVIAAHDVEILIHGHTHRPAIHPVARAEPAYRIVWETGRLSLVGSN